MKMRIPNPRFEFYDPDKTRGSVGIPILLAVGAVIAIWLPAAIFLLS